MKFDITKEVLCKWGVYRITNIITEEYYIGSTTETFIKRAGKHTSENYKWDTGIRKRANCPLLYKAFKEYGIGNFVMSCEFFFNRKKDSLTNIRIATYIEERLIEKYDPIYNICRKPTLAGCPNLGRRLSEEWKRKIGEKSKLYKHKDKPEIYNRKSIQNKELSSVYRIWKQDVEFTGSLIECSEFTGHAVAVLCRWMDNTKSIKGWSIEQLKSQKKGIKLLTEDGIIELRSFGECDRFLKMWRGYTSTSIVNKKDKLLNYEYELL